jgi:glycerol-3-phosphate dehydrogenase subunit B
MPSADVVVIGAGLAGLTAAIELAEGGARVSLVAKGMAATHWAHGGLDIAAPAGAATSAEGVERLRADPSHPYAVIGQDVAPALQAALRRLDAGGLPYAGDLEAKLRQVPTAVGGLRPAAVVPRAQAAALQPWEPGEGLFLLGIERFRDAWPALAARNLARQAWPDGPARIEAASVRLPGLERLRNLGSLTLARLFDTPAWREQALEAMRGAVPGTGTWRIGLPAVIGLEDHPAAFDAAIDRIGRPIFEIPTLPPSIPGQRLFEVLRRRALAAGASIQIGFAVEDLVLDGHRVTAVRTHGAARPVQTHTAAVVLATGGIAGGGLRGERDGRVIDVVAGLPVTAPGRAGWLAGDLYGADGVALERAGIQVDAELRPVGPGGEVLLSNLRVVGSALAGMRYLTERCGDGVAITSAYRAARLSAGTAGPRLVGKGVAS